MKFLTDFTYRNLHGFARFPGDSTALVSGCSLRLCCYGRPCSYRVVDPNCPMIIISNADAIYSKGVDSSLYLQEDDRFGDDAAQCTGSCCVGVDRSNVDEEESSLCSV